VSTTKCIEIFYAHAFGLPQSIDRTYLVIASKCDVTEVYTQRDLNRHNLTLHDLVKLTHVTDFQPTYVSTSTTALSANPAVVVPLLTINGWILMQRKVTGGSVSFNQNWVEYRDGFGSSTSDNYWLGLNKVYRLTQLGNVRLRIEVNLQKLQMLIKQF